MNPDAASLTAALDRARARTRLHMPGHFGRVAPLAVPEWGALAAWDQTESEGLDALSAPTGVLQTLTRRAADAYGAKRAWLSVQGATLPVLAAGLSVAGPGATVVADRRSHRSVLAAAVLGGWRVRWVVGTPGDAPPSAAAWGMVLEQTPRPDLAVVLYPSYEGLAGPLAEVAALAHQVGAEVLVDAAHGAHLGRSPALLPHPLAAGADLVAHGLHKTEPVLTQTGLLLARAQDPARVDEWMRRLATSSPSYLLLASMEQYILNRREGDGGWSAFAEGMPRVWDTLHERGWSVRQREWVAQGGRADVAKLTVNGQGAVLATRLRQAGYEPETVAADSVTLIVGPALGFRAHDWHRLIEALGTPMPPPPVVRLPDVPPAVLTPGAAVRAPRRLVPLPSARGRVAALEVTPYPPGIPVAVAGEPLTQAGIDWISDAVQRGVRLEGVETVRHGGVSVWVVDQDG